MKKGDPGEAGDRELAPTAEETRLEGTRRDLIQVGRLQLSAALLAGGTWAITATLFLAGVTAAGSVLASALMGASVLAVPLGLLMLIASRRLAQRAWSRFGTGERALIRRGEGDPELRELLDEIAAVPEVWLAAELSQAVVVAALLFLAAVAPLPALLRVLLGLLGAWMLGHRLRAGQPAGLFRLPLPELRAPASARALPPSTEGREQRFAGWRPPEG